MGWFRKTEETPRPTRHYSYPDGVAVETEKATYYIKNRMKYRFFSDRVFETWQLAPARGSEASVKGFKSGGILGFRDGSLIQDYSDGRLYIVSGNKRRLITSPDVMDMLGRTDDDIVLASAEEVQLHDEGENL